MSEFNNSDKNKPTLALLICGDRCAGCNSEQWSKSILHNIQSYKTRYNIVKIIHGGCRGIDILSGIVGKSMGISVTNMPAEWNKYGRNAGPRRNREMLSSLLGMKVDYRAVLAFHPDIDKSRGTLNMVKLAMQKCVPTMIIEK